MTSRRNGLTLAAVAGFALAGETAFADDTLPYFEDSYTSFTVNNNFDTANGKQFNAGWGLDVVYELRSTTPMPNGGTLTFAMTGPKGAKLGELVCDVQPNGDGFVAHTPCREDKQRVKAVGDIAIKATYTDGKTGTSTVLRTFAIKVETGIAVRGNLEPSASQQYVSYNGRQFDSVIWTTEDDGYVMFSYMPSYEAPLAISRTNTVFTCKVDGKTLPDVDGGGGYAVNQPARFRPDYTAIRASAKGGRVVTEYLRWAAYELRVPISSGPKSTRNQGLWRLEELPGAWECAWNQRGKPLRTFRFKVADGKILPHPEEGAGLRFEPDRHLLETQIPADNPLDVAFDAKTLGTGFWGRPWATPEGKALGKGLKTRGTTQFPQPKNLDFGKPIKKWE